MNAHPCRTCGACCATFRVSFHWSECDDVQPAGVPAEWVEAAPPHRVVMKGTGREPVRCVALVGEPGVGTACAIYSSRPSPCRDFEASWEAGRANEACDRARSRFGLLPLSPEDWRPAVVPGPKGEEPEPCLPDDGGPLPPLPSQPDDGGPLPPLPRAA